MRLFLDTCRSAAQVVVVCAHGRYVWHKRFSRKDQALQAVDFWVTHHAPEVITADFSRNSLPMWQKHCNA